MKMPYRDEMEFLRAECDRLAREVAKLHSDKGARRAEWWRKHWWEIPAGTTLIALMVTFAIAVTVSVVRHKGVSAACVDGAALLQPGQVVNCNPGERMERLGETNIVLCRCPK